MKPIQMQLSHLEHSGLIAIAQLLPELEYLFRHALVQTAAYESLLRKDRRELHRMVGEVLEAAYPHRLDDLAPTLADHFREADNHPKAVKYSYRAGERALAQYANQEAEMHYRAGLALTPDSADRARLLAGLGAALVVQSRMDEAIRVWGEAIALYRAMNDHDTVARLFAQSARAAWWAGDSLAALDLCEQGLAAVPADLESNGQAALLHEVARSRYFNDDGSGAMEYAHRALALAEALHDASVQAETLITLSLLQSGQEAIHSLVQAVKVAEAHHVLATAGRAHHNLGVVLMAQQTPRDGLPHLQRSAELARQRGMAVDELFALAMVVVNVASQGETTLMWQVRRRMDDLLMQVGRTSTGVYAAKVHIANAMVFYGEFEEAQGLYLECLAVTRQTHDEHTLRDDINHLAEALLLAGNYAGAKAIIEEALGLRESDPTEAATTHYLACIVSLDEGDLARAQAHQQRIHELCDSRANFRLRLQRDMADLRMAAAGHQWEEADRLWAVLNEALIRRGVVAIRNRRLFEWATILYEGDPARNHDQALAVMQEAKAAFEAMQAPAFVQRIEARIAAISEAAR